MKRATKTDSDNFLYGTRTHIMQSMVLLIELTEPEVTLAYGTFLLMSNCQASTMAGFEPATFRKPEHSTK